jgi:hypothetical protein
MVKKEILPLDMTYLVDYDSNRSECNDEYCKSDYCRCTTVNPVVNYILYDSLFSHVKSNIKDKLTQIQYYVIERILRSKININSINAYGLSGYYGEEVICNFSSIELHNEIEEYIKEVAANQDWFAIELYLKIEYGYVLPELNNQSWEIREVDISCVHPPYTKVSDKIVAQYTGDELILCQKVDGINYRLIDGNHRFAAAVKNEIGRAHV